MVGAPAPGHLFDLAAAGLELVLQALLVGAAALLPHDEPRDEGGGRARRLLAAAAAGLLLAAPLALLGRAAMLAGRPPGEALPLLGTVLLQTRYGLWWGLRLGALALLALLLATGRARGGLLWAPVALVLWARAATGHAADAGELSLAVALQAAHALAAGLWAGGVLAGPLLLGPGTPPLHRARLAAALSRLAGWALAAVLLSGAAQALLRLPGPQALWSTAYGVVLAWKLLAVAAMAVLGAYNRFRQLPGLLARGGQGAGPFLGVLQVEGWWALAALLAAAWLGHTPPPRP
ncbi:MAG: hypothetical protein D6809_04695 [Gammaproteobacteria bacterium]|nr:MAG: hypothetical protein D6809_04695 [Gammaproteobacteria bacterium]